MDLNHIFYFVKMVEHGGLTQAGRAPNMPKSKPSRRIDVLGEGYDLALRVRFPPLENTDLVMRVLSASPALLAEHIQKE